VCVCVCVGGRRRPPPSQQQIPIDQKSRHSTVVQPLYVDPTDVAVAYRAARGDDIGLTHCLSLSLSLYSLVYKRRGDLPYLSLFNCSNKPDARTAPASILLRRNFKSRRREKNIYSQFTPPDTTQHLGRAWISCWPVLRSRGENNCSHIDTQNIVHFIENVGKLRCRILLGVHIGIRHFSALIKMVSLAIFN